MDRRECRIQVAHEERVIETDDRDVIRDGQAERGDRADGAEGLKVGTCDDRRHAALQEGVRVGGRGLVRVESLLNDGGVVPDQLAHHLRECLGLAQCRDDVRAAGEKRDTRVTQLVQVSDRGANTEGISGGKVGGRDLGACAVDRDEGDAACGDVVIGGEIGQEVRVPAGDEDEPADAVINKRREVVELGRRARRLRADEGDAARARDLLLKVMGEGGKDRIHQLRHDNADRRSAGRVFTGWTVVAQLINRRQDPAARLFGDLADAVENA